MTSVDPTERRRGREAALQMLYQWEVGRASASEAIATYWPAHDSGGEQPESVRAFANALVRGTIDRVTEIDRLLSAHAVGRRAAASGDCARTGDATDPPSGGRTDRRFG